MFYQGLAILWLALVWNRSLRVIKHILVFFRDGNAPFWWLKNELVICWDGNFSLVYSVVVV